jgi:hypothetical protein
MKQSIFKTVFTALLLVLFLSCGSDDDGDNGGNPNNEDTFLTAKVDGVDFEVRGSLFASSTSFSGIEATFMDATYNDDSKTINMGISNLNSTGTYTLFDAMTDDPLTSTYLSSLIYGEGDEGWLATFFQGNVSGTVTITELDAGYLVGTFQFTGYNINDETEKNITEGSFRFKRI